MKSVKIALFLLLFVGKLYAQQPTVVAVPVQPPPPPPSNVTAPTWQGFRLGLEVEPLLDWGKAKDNTISSSGVKPDFGFGIMGDFFFSRNYALNVGVTFIYLAVPITYNDSTTFNISPKGNTTFAPPTTVNYKLQYVEVPIDFKLKTDQVGYLSYYGQFGGAVGFNIGSKADFTTPGNVNNMSNVTLSGNVNLINLGLLIGGGVEYNIVGHTNLVGGVSYVNNFTNFTGKPANASLNHFNLNIGVFF